MAAASVQDQDTEEGETFIERSPLSSDDVVSVAAMIKMSAL